MKTRLTTLAYKKTLTEHTYRFCYQCDGLYDTAEEKILSILTCPDCHRHVHASCAGLNDVSLESASNYDWKCNDCKTCIVCHSKQNKANMVLCVSCDRSIHVTCNPDACHIPKGDWYCDSCLSITSTPSNENISKRDSALLQLSENMEKTMEHSSKRRSRQKSTLRGINSNITAKASMLPTYDTEQRSSTRKSLTLKKREQINFYTRNQKQHDYTTTIPAEFSLTNENDRGDYFATFGHHITKEESNTVRGTPSQHDRDLFKKSRIHLKPEQQMDLPDVPLESDSFVGPRYTNRTFPKTNKIQFGDHAIDIWFSASSYPEEYNQYPTIYICEYCLMYMKSAYTAERHKTKCSIHRPPGKEIYRNGKISIFEVNGRNHKSYCQNLCLLAKLFLDHKTLFLDVEPFFFYVMTERDNDDFHLVGYFSKENRSPVTCNVCCIMTMPNHQRKGYGQYLIDFSYLLSKREGLVGSPEKPLSDLGLISYRSYWKDVIFRLLQHQTDPISIDDISTKTSMTPDDIVATLRQYDMISSRNHVYLNSTAVQGSSTMSVPSSSPFTYKLHIDVGMINAHVNKMNKRQCPALDPSKLIWTPSERKAA